MEIIAFFLIHGMPRVWVNQVKLILRFHNELYFIFAEIALNAPWIVRKFEEKFGSGLTAPSFAFLR